MNSFALKLLALITMIIDHVGAIFYPQYPVLRIIGRLAFPIYAYLLAEGYAHTKNLKSYGLRLLAFALISEIPFDYAFFGKLELTHQNIFFTLFLGLLAIWFIDTQNPKNMAVAFIGVILAIMASEYLHTDYGTLGILYIISFHMLKNTQGMEKLLLMTFLLAVLNFLLSGGLQNYSVLAAVFISLHDGTPGPRGKVLQYAFYAAYPVHLLVLFLLKGSGA